MVWHDAPCQQSVAFRVEMEECPFHQGRDFRPAKPAETVAGVEIGGNALLQFDGPQPRRLRGKLMSPTPDNVGRQRVKKPKSHTLNQMFSIEMWKIAARVPWAG